MMRVVEEMRLCVDCTMFAANAEWMPEDREPPEIGPDVVVTCGGEEECNDHGQGTCDGCGQRWHYAKWHAAARLANVSAWTSDRVEPALRQALVTLLWQSIEITEDGGELETYSGDHYDVSWLPDDIVSTVRRQLVDFLEDGARPILADVDEPLIWDDAGQIGHDWVLTARGHGAGFWDRYWGNQPGVQIGNALSDASEYSLDELEIETPDGGWIHA